MLSEPFATFRLDASWTSKFTRGDDPKLCGAKRGDATLLLYMTEDEASEPSVAARRERAEAFRAAALHHAMGEVTDEAVGGVTAACAWETCERQRIAGCALLETEHDAVVDFGEFRLGIQVFGKYFIAKPADGTVPDETEALFLEVYPYDPNGGAAIAQAFRDVLAGASFTPQAIEGVTVEALVERREGDEHAVCARIAPGFVLPGLCRVSSTPSCREEAWEWRVTLATKPFRGSIVIGTDHVECETRTEDIEAFRDYLVERTVLLKRLNGDWAPILDGLVDHFLSGVEDWRDPDEVPEPYTRESLREALTRALVFLSTPGGHDPSAMSISFYDEDYDVLGGHGLGVFFDAQGNVLRYEQN